MLQKCMEDTNIDNNGTLHIWSDSGPHFRSAENLHFYTRQLPMNGKREVRVQWLGEQHGKGLLDQLFGQIGTQKNGWIARYVRKSPVHTIDDVVLALSEGAKHTKKLRPDGPNWVIKKIIFPEFHQSTTSYYYAKSLKITRTYSLKAVPHPLQDRAGFPPHVYDCLFADSSSCKRIDDLRLETVTATEPVPWRKTFFNAEKEWETGAPNPADPHRLKRVWETQRGCKPPHGLFHTRTFDEKIARMQKSQSKKTTELKKKSVLLKAMANSDEIPNADVEAPDASASSSSTSTSSDSD